MRVCGLDASAAGLDVEDAESVASNGVARVRTMTKRAT